MLLMMWDTFLFFQGILEVEKYITKTETKIIEMMDNWYFNNSTLIIISNLEWNIIDIVVQ